jgi:hypothetical protein
MRFNLNHLMAGRIAAGKQKGRSQVQQQSPDFYRGTQKFPQWDIEVNTFSARLIAEALEASWKIHIGENLFTQGGQLSRSAWGRVTVTVDGGSLQSPVARVYSVVPGQNVAENEVLAQSLGPGTYRVGLFVYMEYQDREGKHRVLTRSVTPLEIIH